MPFTFVLMFTISAAIVGLTRFPNFVTEPSVLIVGVQLFTQISNEIDIDVQVDFDSATASATGNHVKILILLLMHYYNYTSVQPASTLQLCLRV